MCVDLSTHTHTSCVWVHVWLAVLSVYNVWVCVVGSACVCVVGSVINSFRKHLFAQNYCHPLKCVLLTQRNFYDGLYGKIFEQVTEQWRSLTDILKPLYPIALCLFQCQIPKIRCDLLGNYAKVGNYMGPTLAKRSSWIIQTVHTYQLWLIYNDCWWKYFCFSMCHMQNRKRPVVVLCVSFSWRPINFLCSNHNHTNIWS